MKEVNRLHCPSLDFSMYVYMLERNIEMFQTDKTSQVPPSSPLLDAWGQPTLHPLLPINAPVNLKIDMLQSSLKDLQDKKQSYENDLKLLDTAINKIKTDIMALEASEEAIFIKTLEKAKQLFDKGNVSEEFLQALEALKKAVQ